MGQKAVKEEQESKRYHRFQMTADEDIVGTIYVPKDFKTLPDTLILERVRQ